MSGRLKEDSLVIIVFRKQRYVSERKIYVQSKVVEMKEICETKREEICMRSSLGEPQLSAVLEAKVQTGEERVAPRASRQLPAAHKYELSSPPQKSKIPNIDS